MSGREQIGCEWLFSNILIHLTKKQVVVADRAVGRFGNIGNVCMFKFKDLPFTLYAYETSSDGPAQLRKHVNNRFQNSFNVSKKQDLQSVLDDNFLGGIPTSTDAEPISSGALFDGVKTNLKKEFESSSMVNEDVFTYLVHNSNYDFKAMASKPAQIQVFLESKQLETFDINRACNVGSFVRQIHDIKRYPAEDVI